MAEGEHIQLRDEGMIRRLVFNRPEKRNALTFEMVERALEAVERFAADDAVRVLIFSGGGGKAFVSGADISEFDRHEGAEEEFLHLASRMFDAVYDTPKPTIAMINGYCFGGGMALAAACDLRYASDDASFCIPAARLGIGYSVTSTRRIVDLAGAAATREMLFSARRYDAGEAERMGLINRVYPGAELVRKTTEIAEAISRNAPLSVRSAKRNVAYLLSRTDEGGEQFCNELVDACTRSEDFVEGRAAHAEKRRPRFRGS